LINTRTGFDGNEIVLLQLFARQWVSPIVRDVFLYETTFVDVPRLRRHDWVLRRFARDPTEKHPEGGGEGLLRRSLTRTSLISSPPASMSQQKLVYAIIEFLNKSLEDGTVKQDDKEGLEVASASQNLLSDPIVELTAVSSLVQCIGEAFGVDPSDDVQSERLSIKPATLETVFDLFLKTRDKVASSSAPPKPAGPTVEDKANADKLKQKGNSLMSGKNYDEAIETYTKAIELDPTNPVYYSNRAAAHSSKGDHLSATGDAEKAIEVDPSYVKAYHRLG